MKKITLLKNIIYTTFLIVKTTTLPAQKIAAGGWHSLAICNDSIVKAFGENATGQLGDGTTTDKNTPVTVNGLSGIIAVSAGGDQLEAHSMALRSNGTVWAWGSNIYGGLGNGTTNSSNNPVQVLLLSGVKAISAGGWHSVALKNDGTVWTWGWNIDGQLGDGTTTDKTIPTQVPGLTNVIKVVAGTYHVLALKNDGTVWAWGDNISGQIGDGTTADRTSPVQVSGLSGITDIAAGRFFSLAIKNDGTVWTWGENLYGQLGNGNTNNSSVPIQVNGLNGVTLACCGAFHCMAVKNDGTIWAWGRNTYGNLGDNTVAHKSSPVQMIGITNAVGLAAGTNFSLLYKADGTFWGCGRNASGQLGDGTFTQRNTATQATALCPVMQEVGIKEQMPNSGSLSAFPNPSSDGVFQIILPPRLKNASSEKFHIEIFNSIGKLIRSELIESNYPNQKITINLNDETPGVYLIKLKTDKEETYTQKIIKQ